MSSSWKTSLSQMLNRLANQSGNMPRVAIVGIGNPQRCDDVAGILIARALLRRECAADSDHIFIIEAGHAPENVTRELRDFAPNLILLIDAVDMRATIGAIEFISIQSVEGIDISTHSLPLSMLARYLTLELNCTVALIGVQPKSIEVGEIISAEIFRAVDEIVAGICETCFTIRPA